MLPVISKGISSVFDHQSNFEIEAFFSSSKTRISRLITQIHSESSEPLSYHFFLEKKDILIEIKDVFSQMKTTLDEISQKEGRFNLSFPHRKLVYLREDLHDLGKYISSLEADLDWQKNVFKINRLLSTALMKMSHVTVSLNPQLEKLLSIRDLLVDSDELIKMLFTSNPFSIESGCKDYALLIQKLSHCDAEYAKIIEEYMMTFLSEYENLEKSIQKEIIHKSKTIDDLFSIYRILKTLINFPFRQVAMLTDRKVSVDLDYLDLKLNIVQGLYRKAVLRSYSFKIPSKMKRLIAPSTLGVIKED